MKKRSIIVGLAFIIIALAMQSCFNDSVEELYPIINPCDTTNITYANFVKNVIDRNCATSNCHDAATKQSNVQLDNYESIRVTALDNSKGAPGKLMGTIRHTSGFSQMPSGLPKLDDCTIARISAWVNAGMPQ